MKITLTILAVTAGLFLSGYKIEAFNDTENKESKKMLQYSTRNNQLISYNPDGTPDKINWSLNASNYTTSFLYSPGRINYSITRENKKHEQGYFTLDAGRIVSLNWISFDNNEEPAERYNENFSYNEKGLLRKQTFNTAYSEHSYNSDDNLIQTAHYNSSGNPTTIVTYQYTSIRDRSLSVNVFTTNGSVFFLPRFSNKLPAAKKVTRVSTGSITLQGRFSYELNTEGYVTRGKWDAISAGDADFEWTNRFE